MIVPAVPAPRITMRDIMPPFEHCFNYAVIVSVIGGLFDIGRFTMGDAENTYMQAP